MKYTLTLLVLLTSACSPYHTSSVNTKSDAKIRPELKHIVKL